MVPVADDGFTHASTVRVDGLNTGTSVMLTTSLGPLIFKTLSAVPYIKPLRTADPSVVVKLILPAKAVGPTTAVICVSDCAVKDAAEIPPKETAVVVFKRIPLMVTVLPEKAVVGWKDKMRGTFAVKPAKENPPIVVVMETEPLEPAEVIIAFI